MQMLSIDEEFQSVIRPLDAEEHRRLEESILAEGCRDPIVVWSGVVIDGMNRFDICTANAIAYKIHEMEFANREQAMAWIIRNQFARRNITMADKAKLVSKLLPLVSAAASKLSTRMMEEDKATMESAAKTMSHIEDVLKLARDPKADPRSVVAKMAGISRAQVTKAKKVMDEATPAQKKRLDAGDASINKLYTEIRESEKAQSSLTFNPTTERVGFAKWTWNPYTGCHNKCKWCYARDMASRFKLYEEGFAPTFRREKLAAPFNTRIPVGQRHEEGIHRVFVCSMGELFGAWVFPGDRDQILDVVRRCAKENTRARPKFPPWTFVFLTKFPYGLLGIQWPDNVWVGASVTDQSRVAHAERAFEGIDAPVKFLSCEPLHTDLTFSRLDLFDLVMIGARTRTKAEPAFQPPWEWVEHLLFQCRDAGVKVYFKDNLKVRPMEYPD